MQRSSLGRLRLLPLLAWAAVGREDVCPAKGARGLRDHILLQKNMQRADAAIVVTDADAQTGNACCFSWADPSNACGTCYASSMHTTGWCAASQARCQQCSSSAAWCTVKGVTTTKTTTTTKRKANATKPAVSTGFCCFSARDTANVCSTCWPRSMDSDGSCSKSQADCTRCSPTAVYCPFQVPHVEPAPAPSTAKTTSTTPAPALPGWITGTWTTGYWDCCKPSCSWPNKGSVTSPTLACDATGRRITNPNEPSVCQGGKAASCANFQPFIVAPRLSLGFAAAAVSGDHGLVGDSNCGQCYLLKFVQKSHADGYNGWGGSAAGLVGKSIIVQVINIGYDVSGEHSFDIQIPGAGQGAFSSGCVAEYPGKNVGDFDCDNRYGGCHEKSGCNRLPSALQPGCNWRYDWYHWLEADGVTNNPYVDFRRVKCPKELVQISGSAPTDDAKFPAVDFSTYS